MWSYYDLVVAQDQADRLQSVGYRTSPGAKREVTQEAIARHLNQQHQAEKEKKDAARRSTFVTVVNAIKAIFRSRTVLVR